MTQEEKQLLIKDLCARLPYGVQILADSDKKFDGGVIARLSGIVPYTGKKYDIKEPLFYQEGCPTPSTIEEVRPYLRPMSSMTEGEIDEVKKICDEYDLLDECGELVCRSYGMTVLHSEVEDGYPYNLKIKISQNLNYAVLDFLNAHHFDYRGLIEKNLALDCTGLNIYRIE